MRFASLGSGSRGNALIIDSGQTRLLLDCGFSVRATVERLGRLGVLPQDISAVLLTHEHSDHVTGAFSFARRFGIPVHLTYGTLAALPQSRTESCDCRLIDSCTSFVIGDFEVQPFPVPHDAREPVQYVFHDGIHRLGVLTDSGSITPHIVDVLRTCHGLVLECNHDSRLLAASAYPAMLKRRIAGGLGHLENDQAAGLLRQIDTRHLQHLVAAHLSEQNNRPELAALSLSSVLGCTPQWIGIADQAHGFDWRQLL